MPLSEAHRSKLDSVVSQMEANGEAPDAIQAVVEDFKAKYSSAGVQAPAAQAPQKPGFIQSAAEHFGPTSALAHPGKLAEDFGNFFGEFSPRDVLPDRIGAGAIDIGRNLVSGMQ